MNSFAKFSLLCVICIAIVSLTTKLLFAADPGPDSATCAISVTVDSIIEWEGANFAAIDLDSQEAAISAQAHTPEGSSVYTLWTNCNVALSANNTTASQLSDGTDTLVTKYKMSEDGDGVATTGATAAAEATSGVGSYVLYDSFLSSALAITHVNTDGAVEVTLYVEASNAADEVSDSGDYTAIQTITATWVSDN